MKALFLFIGPLVAAAAGMLANAYGLPAPAAWTAAITALCAVWWVSEAIPIPATSLVPIAALPLVGAIPPPEVGKAYGHPLILLLTGGFMLSTALERSGAHRRLALAMIRLVSAGGRVTGRRLVIGFMLAAAVLSMWVSNAATTLMLIPIALATLGAAGSSGASPRLRNALLLGVAYAASVAGTMTPIGTPPNLLCINALEQGPVGEVTFSEWIGWAVPAALPMLIATALWLTRGLSDETEFNLPEIGRWRSAEIRTLAVFVATAVLWVTRTEPFGGWSKALGLVHANDASVALLAVVAMFLIPSGDPPKPGEPAPRLLDWPTAVAIPWGMLLLFSGGMVLAQAFTSSGLAEAISAGMSQLAQLPAPLLLISLCLSVTFLTEVTSNTATTALLMPLLATVAQATDIDPRLLMVPAAISASYAFMLPVATVPNAAVYGAGADSGAMAREGFVLNLIGAVLLSMSAWWSFGGG
ncbi:SLC13 family permease [Botrimarina hoheduenensis]|uniref:Sodium-dependent dicarboxylate transporter SdcS n=1 Tax=Botrimarina hoheduenensis TaxID=2528000 RepID=A0A5C5WBT9_9BACT|nr:SLC13 family permease [Botrimarina hoheduenensis]TWT47565.1 Sodium-dependent dicarboxylate transporter SdcS [Botrimarina hoheduenensis]